MKLLLDENLSPRLVRALIAAFPGSLHVRDVRLVARQDIIIWQWARENEFVILTQDDDFRILSQLRGQPPKVICLRFGNQRVRAFAEQLGRQRESIERFVTDDKQACLELFCEPFLN